MRVLITGAYGLLGAAIVTRLHRDGHAVVGLGRSLSAARRRFPFVRWVEADFARLTDAQAWRPLLDNIDAVVNCVGAFQHGARDDLKRVHVEAPVALFAACTRYGPRRVIQVSAIGADAGGPTEFARTKGEADATLAASALDWLILRPGVVVASNVYGATAMLRGLAGLPWVVPLFAPDRDIELVTAADVAETVAWSMLPSATLRQTFELVHPQKVTLGEVVAAQRAWLGFAPARIVPLPDLAVRLVTKAADAIGWLGWRSPARSTATAQITQGIAGDPAAWS